MSSGRAETYLAVLAEAELRRVGDELRRLDAAAGDDLWSDPGMGVFRAASSAQWKVNRTGRILVTADVLDVDYLAHVSADLHAAMKIRSRLLLNWDRRRGVLGVTLTEPASSPPRPPRDAMQPARVTPIGQAIRVTSEHASAMLHLMSLVRTPTAPVITVVMRWQATGTGPEPLPSGHLAAVDDQGARYDAVFHGDRRGTTWAGVIRLSSGPPDGISWLELIDDETSLIRLPFGPASAPIVSRTQPAVQPPGDRLLELAAERLLASEDAEGPAPDLGEILTVLTDNDALAADSPVPAQVAALRRRFGGAGDVSGLPERWASVLDRHGSRAGSDFYAPFGVLLPDVDGARFALAGLSTAGGRSDLHVIGSGTPLHAKWFAYDWEPGYSWWLRDDAGNWHLGAADEPSWSGDGMYAFRVRLTPPLASVPATVEVEVTGPATRVSVTAGCA